MEEFMCRVFECVRSVGDDKRGYLMKKGDILIETFTGSNIFRPERMVPGVAGIELSIFEDHNINDFLKPLPSVLMHETKNFKGFYKDSFEKELLELEEGNKVRQCRIDSLKIMLGEYNG